MHLIDLLDMAVAGGESRQGVGPKATPHTYADIRAEAAGVAALARSCHASSLAMIAPNHDSIPALLFGADLAGIPFAPLNYRLADASLQALLLRTPGALVVSAEDKVADRLGVVPGVQFVSAETAASFVAADLSDEAASADEDFEGDDVAITLFTSGTTGTPKAASLRHRYLVSYVLANVDFMSASEDEASLVSVPPYHIAGMMAVLTSIFSGRRLVYLPTFTPESWVEKAVAEDITHAMVVPTMLGRILNLLEETGTELPSLRHLSSGGGRMPRPVIERALAMLPQVDFVNAYGLTETSSTITILGPSDHREAFSSNDPVVANRLGSVGRPLPNVELIVRSDEGIAAPGGVGEIWVRGDHIAAEYAGQRDVTDEGWFRTRDRGWLDDAGYLYLDGRLDDVIVRGGENISPAEIEDVLLTSPEIVDAAVFGVPDDEWGEAVAAAVVLRSGSDLDEGAVKELIRLKLRSSRTPSTVAFVSDLPYSETGKLLRRVLADRTRTSL